jgi:hypothetical protein
MGDYKGVSLAEKLKMKTDGLHSTRNLSEYNELRSLILKEADKAASDGYYDYTMLDDRLSDPKMLDTLKRGLQKDGFKVDGGVDEHHSEHAGRVMYYIHISWK